MRGKAIMKLLRIARMTALLGVLVAVLAVLLGDPGPALAATITVTTTTDELNADGDCSLREAVRAANLNTPVDSCTAGSGVDTIDVPPGTYTLSVVGTGEDAAATGDLDIAQSATLNGPGVTVSAQGLNDRSFHVLAGTTVTISGFTIQNGGTSTFMAGAGILNQGTLTVTQALIRLNSPGGLGGFSTGGGINNSGNLSVFDSTVTQNGGQGAGIYNSGTASVTRSAVTGNNSSTLEGGGIFNVTGSFTMTDSTVSNNLGIGAGIYNASGTFTMNTSTVSSNNGAGGGGVYVIGGTVNVIRSTVRDNSGGSGGGLGVNGGGLNVIGSTVSGNIATFSGGGIYSQGNVAVASSTIAGNSAPSGSGVFKQAGSFTTRNTIIATNTSATNCGGPSLITSNGYNIAGDASCNLVAAGDLPSTNPLLGPLTNNGGTTLTHAPLSGSPAVEAGVHTFLPDCSGGDELDQRGIVRPVGSRCDIGAIEAPDSDTDGLPDPIDPDDDGDNVADTFDVCPLNGEDSDGFEDGDGCPDTDNDVDGVLDVSDVGLYTWQNPLGGSVDCRNVAEDYDGFHDDDGCPEPDNDYDTFQDFADDCPGADSNAGPDGIADTGDEPVLYLTPYQAREDFDGVIDWDGCHDSPDDDYDGDGAGDETEVFTMLTDPVNPDTDADAVVDGTDNCPNWVNAAQTLPSWNIPANDSDCDGWNVAREQHVGTDATKHCNTTSTLNDEADNWPTDFNDSRTTNLSDVVLIGPAYNLPTGGDPAKERFDLNASGAVNLSDVVLIGPFYNKNCLS
jgi:CSLREA domain-containing protein